MHTFPAAFIERMKILLEAEMPAFLQALQTEAPSSIRLNPGKICPTDLISPAENLEKVAWCEGAYYLRQRPVFTLDPCLHAGAYYVQEASSMFLRHVLQQIMPTGPIRALDLCAAPGGKSTLLASQLSSESLLVSNEVIRSRARILKENIIKWGQCNIVVTNNDPADFSALEGAFDLILVDAPCSGEGMFRKDPKAIEEWSENNLQLCSERQKRILSDIWKCLRPEGILIYSTCTFNPGENEILLEWLVNKFEAHPVPIRHSFETITPGYSALPCYRFYPHKTKGEGFFIGVVQKHDGTVASLRKNKKRTLPPTVKLPAELQALLRQPQEYTAYSDQTLFGVVPTRQADFIQHLRAHLHVVYQGCELAEHNNRKLKPAPALALCQQLNRENCALYPVDRNTALSFLKKEDIPVPRLKDDWLLINYENLALGWCKNLGSRLNNYYPKEWRIRMDLPE